MEAKELMICDWVRNKKTCNIFQWSSEDYTESITDNIDPIPLTTEILEKNGFKKKDYGDYILIYGDAFIGWKPTRRKLRILVSDEYQTIAKDILIQSEHIHTMQHALRLCGLHELADNLKIIERSKEYVDKNFHRIAEEMPIGKGMETILSKVQLSNEI